LHWDEKAENFVLKDKDGNISQKHLLSIAEGYERKEKKHKVVRQWKNNSPSIIPINFENIGKGYDHFMFVDTNYTTIEGNFLCVTACIFVEKFEPSRSNVGTSHFNLLHFPRLLFVARQSAQPEKYGWHRMIEALLGSNLYDITKNYTIMVDSELGDIPQMNAREIPYFADHFLAENMDLTYVSADVGKECWPNQFMSICDKISSLILEDAKKHLRGKVLSEYPKEYFDLAAISHDDGGYIQKVSNRMIPNTNISFGTLNENETPKSIK
jgi:hypothetical protein